MQMPDFVIEQCKLNCGVFVTTRTPQQPFYVYLGDEKSDRKKVKNFFPYDFEQELLF